MAMKWLKIEREINTRKQEGIPQLVVLGPHFQPELAHQLLLPRYMLLQAHPHQVTHLLKGLVPMYTRNLTDRSSV